MQKLSKMCLILTLFLNTLTFRVNFEYKIAKIDVL